MNNDSKASIQPPAPTSDDEIDLGQLVSALKRHWKLIAKVAGGTFLLSAIYAFAAPRVWEGEFQIVLASKESKSGGGAQAFLQSNPGLASLTGLKGDGDALKTEVKILESPSVLKPVYDYVRRQKALQGVNVDDLRFDDWIKSVEVKLEKETSVLNVAYQDNDRELIVNVISRISQAYQLYSGRDRERGISQAIRYLDLQIGKYRVKGVASLRKAQQFAIEQDLTALKGEEKGDAEVINSLNIEAVRVQAANEIRNINEQLKQLNALSNDPEALMYMGSNIPELASKGLPVRLDQIDMQLAMLKSKFTNKEDAIRRLQESRLVLIRTLRRQTYGYLLAKRASAQARLAAAERPKGVLIRYRELLREAARDEATLTQLEVQRQALALEQARKEDPWELISTPTLLDRPVSPRKGRNMALGLLAGLVLGSGAALVVDRRGGKVWSLDELRSALPYPLLAQLELAEPASWKAPLALLADGALQGCPQVALISVMGPLPNDLQQILQAALQLSDPAAQVVATTDLTVARNCQAQLLVLSPGMASREQLVQLRQNIELQGQPVAGLLVINGA
ncbi:hypothetical protein KBY58_00775 [Cyanobium sp. HWJ4-Hawea]|uniref:GumC family protein n=1 Tax=Cyanobium sp. HWJ4-Hawea TaxID=2823713 RepID=UPI0020CD29B5|nr:Wzz/FepE/Etk N-terminal domain-containing protein [Cyanobium sp. HWJ4-Hawea]MCP9807964.1 hypothetical protein [Cyanobium sp. HWJ4-Hawea]